jgi:hypothetical protein
MENKKVSDGESPVEPSMPGCPPVPAGAVGEGCLTGHWVVESASAVMRASMLLNWLQLKTGSYCCCIRFQIATTLHKEKKWSMTLHPKAANAR